MTGMALRANSSEALVVKIEYQLRDALETGFLTLYYSLLAKSCSFFLHAVLLG